jgi:rRNA maturation endonuclease Nob1
MMEIVTAAIILAVCAFVIYPLFRGGDTVHQSSTDSERRLEDLLHQQQMIQNTLDDLEFDASTGKLSDGDFALLTADLKKQQSELDVQMKNTVGVSSAELTARLELEIAAYKSGQVAAAHRCPKCGKQLQAEDQFCSSCGNKI